MANIPWSTERNLENSLADFLLDAISVSSSTVPDENGTDKTISVRVGSEFNDNWSLPIITLYSDSKLSPRLSIGSNLRQKTYLLILDIRALDVGSQQDLTDWLEATINDGFPFYEYSQNLSDPNNPNRTQTGYVSIEFVSNLPVRFGDTADLPDKYRQNVTISCFIE